jgi:hypothetical protein
VGRQPCGDVRVVLSVVAHANLADCVLYVTVVLCEAGTAAVLCEDQCRGVA